MESAENKLLSTHSPLMPSLDDLEKFHELIRAGCFEPVYDHQDAVQGNEALRIENAVVLLPRIVNPTV